MEAIFHTFVTSYFLSEECYKDLLINWNITNISCLKMLISKSLGFAIVVGAAVVKFPQIIKVYRAGSVEGLSLPSLIMELLAVVVNVAYNVVKGFPFSTWGEGAFLMIQTSIQTMQILYYRKQRIPFYLFLPVLAAFSYFLISDYCGLPLLSKLTWASMPTIAASKLTQIGTNIYHGSTGQLSMVTIVLIFGGSLGRVFTTIQETADPILLTTYIVTSSLNGVLVMQIIYYFNNVIDKTKKKL
ncbi:Mannose-P-dolichol utilization defect 1 protein [Trichoplax sp. H2]|uniref:Mannose-P-dolichol utilization defect 1 protein homolog n=1 Tax=Trichoplax adhaerens TaxID=10228 RepID=B3RNK6_TRIAD|nr:hypothetical protein TRIADDRAFT_21873 [Trichoplax adhaerens]EDV27471.1 hypothetical protein TRIADDRAFT_21873 [Trichoplax adhaerens]RDD38663.1 Mannose-P-dolichol utilization defect 1 protein [Trichoplax sp. H2]|eukprot:XP_002109305.1 hypothetical protein TRIADDRAFT_21873 [Trichoplax adhaerens]